MSLAGRELHRLWLFWGHNWCKVLTGCGMLCISAKFLGLWIRCLEGKPVAASACFAGQAWLCGYADFASLPELRGDQLLSADYDAHGLKDRIIPLDVPFALHINPGVG